MSTKCLETQLHARQSVTTSPTPSTMHAKICRDILQQQIYCGSPPVSAIAGCLMPPCCCVLLPSHTRTAGRSTTPCPGAGRRPSLFVLLAVFTALAAPAAAGAAPPQLHPSRPGTAPCCLARMSSSTAPAERANVDHNHGVTSCVGRCQATVAKSGAAHSRDTDERRHASRLCIERRPRHARMRALSSWHCLSRTVKPQSSLSPHHLTPCHEARGAVLS